MSKLYQAGGAPGGAAGGAQAVSQVVLLQLQRLKVQPLKKLIKPIGAAIDNNENVF
ncbi:hypothetical protein GRS66_000064 [Saccharomyces pastorianus]|uniref:Uncharacterized protein n=1 Tax=Saccharomyces pastorianus TaxID=27292 RepID=A0A6C1DMI9_SACPS|nr:hypothetical protein GRS66_000064 [Saccharomyces pastorianus]